MTTLAESPLPQAEPSEQDIITGLQQTVSASRLALFLQCRLKFWFRYVLKLTKPKTPSLHLGNTVHAVLKGWNKARWLQNPLTLKQAHDAYTAAWADNTEGSVNWDPGEEEEEKTTGWRLVDTYLREHHVPAEVKPDAVEVPVEADLRRHGLPKLIGILDLVQQRKIIDYKTIASTPTPEKVAHSTEIQTSSYAILYRHNTGNTEAGIQLHHLVKLKNPRVVITSLPPISQQQETRLYRQMDAYLDGLQQPHFVPSPGMHCSSCEFFNECRRA
ncbi:PD-(D/E)XK nuclease family protein [Roseimicrobium sp. ORNL1]|uniref:RecB family exonuclease n=1 Tax=Roseimicrobium sp. ORNL1 TaxID=2711231 RepID=UPI0013E1B505|nr:PD-(D/E)XK nuclease family protein [Roseimicrobium sp. ORNL1]QIF02839.1 PD-(D/E)XK nuclease family protein [Roseimicrobium sp. ORNL1]